MSTILVGSGAGFKAVLSPIISWGPPPRWRRRFLVLHNSKVPFPFPLYMWLSHGRHRLVYPVARLWWIERDRYLDRVGSWGSVEDRYHIRVFLSRV